MAVTRKLSHVDANGAPTMVDVSAKPATRREASAVCDVVFPRAAATALKRAGLRSAKGPVLDTAIVAGVMAAKRTHELIPFCHALALENCRIGGEFVDAKTLRLTCTATLTGKTGVEMEALVGVTVAALTVYDMCKALSHDIVLREARLLSKSGGKHDVKAERRR
jgi:cyclic pyranopterin monophosphate synthase